MYWIVKLEEKSVGDIVYIYLIGLLLCVNWIRNGLFKC